MNFFLSSLLRNKYRHAEMSLKPRESPVLYSNTQVALFLVLFIKHLSASRAYLFVWLVWFVIRLFSFSFLSGVETDFYLTFC